MRFTNVMVTGSPAPWAAFNTSTAMSSAASVIRTGVSVPRLPVQVAPTRASCEVWNDRRLAYEYLPTNGEHWQTALDTQRDLARTGRHRAVGVHDLLTAAIAAAHNLIVVHYDSDFETAATVLTFQHVWVLPRGTVP
jgi:predicted nucleic acid-binding protein